MSTVPVPPDGERAFQCLAGGGQMGERMRLLDWSKTSLGPLSSWPQSLRTSVSICLNSAFAILVWWGPDLVMLYNDAYSALVSNKHPKALGSPGKEVFPEIWDTIGPMLAAVMLRGEAVRADDLLLSLQRNGYAEECYFTFSYSPILDESGEVGGVFTPVQETTERVIGERRLRTLSRLAAVRAGKAGSAEEACWGLAVAMGENAADLPYAAIYLFNPGGNTARRVALAGRAESRVPPTVDEAARWPPVQAILEGAPIVECQPAGNVGAASPGEQTLDQCVALPLPQSGGGKPKGFVVVGLNPHKRLDPSYRSFISLVAGHIAAAVADAEASEQERKRIAALAELDRAKTAFFSNVSHEFRTPLTLMLGPLEAMMERSGPAITVQADELSLVHRNGMRLLKLVNTLLDFARIEAGRVEAVYEPVDLATLTADTASAFRSAMEQAGLKFVIDCPPLPEPAFVDRDMWEKIVLNLLSNAFKYTLAGTVAVRTRAAQGRLELRVEDTGAGIPPAELPKVFDRFHRVEGAHGRTHEGTGIGLSLVHELVKLHGGTVRVESEVGRGSTFIVSIPQGSAHLPAERLRSVRMLSSTGVAASAYVDEALRWLPEKERAPQPLPVFASDSVQAPHAEPSTGRILLADDNADMRAYVERLLGPYYEVEVVSNGAEALAAAHRHPPDLVLTDVMMPELDGFALLRELRARESTSTIPVILLSARAGEDARVEGLQAGADDYIVKPFTARELLARVGAHLAMTRLRHEAAEREHRLRAEVAETLRRSEKLAVAGRMAATVAHELNNPLTIAINLLYLAQRENDSDKRCGQLESAERELKRVARLANRTLSFYRGGQQKEAVAIAALIEEVAGIFEPVCRAKNTHVECMGDPELAVFGSKDEVTQVIMNLLSNAVDAVESNGAIRVRWKQVRDWRTGNAMAAVVVADSGPGIRDDHLARMFEPFFTTKQNSGTGLGLWIVQEIVQKHGGSIRVRTRAHGPRTGTVIVVRLPQAPAEQRPAVNAA